MYVRIVDEEGFYIEDSFVEELTEYTIENKCRDGFYKPKWCFFNEEWIEGLSEEEIKALKDTETEEVHGLSEIEQLKLNQAVQFEIMLEMLGGMM